MDNITHSLAGAIMGQAGLKKKTGLGMATLIIGANLPDIDAVTSVLGVGSLSIRRGVTHGPIALLLLPILLAWAMIAFDRWQTKRGTRPSSRLPLNAKWLLILAYIGTISHPLLDLLNNYGVRLLEPFSSQWYYGDTIFIIDIWMLFAMGLGLWLSRKREKEGRSNWRIPAFGAFAAVVAYIATNGLITNQAEAMTANAVKEQHGGAPDLVISNPLPVTFWRREMLWRGNGEIGKGQYDWTGGHQKLKLETAVKPVNLPDRRVADAAFEGTDLASFLFWARIPFVEKQQGDGYEKLTLRDARFLRWPVADRFLVKIDVTDTNLSHAK